MAEKPLVFLVHGMGAHPPGWSAAFVKILRKASKSYAFFQERHLADLIEFHEVCYDQIFRNTLANWEENSRRILQLAAPMDREMVEKALGWMEGLAEEQDNFVWSHVADVALWKLAPYLKKMVKTEVATQITGRIHERLAASPVKDVSCAVIAHSLGTSVTSETLMDLARGSWTEGEQGFDPRFFRFECLHMIANVARILETPAYPVYPGPVRPGPAGEANSYCRHYYNYRHDLDPFTRVRTFRPDWDERSYHDKNVSHIHALNVHGMEHYALNPLVHISILRSLCGYRCISGAEERDALAGFTQIKGISKARIEELRAHARQAQEALGEAPDVIDILKGVALYFRGMGGERP
ncbi:hypothetical protein SAMN05660860_01216 [Geoalkalibacter ferrihydriticus]|uniref:Alpha/beta hydrolase n=2 Tax=Geoalkalibacter ferrihydriticus TaxID=392333 RepID=A0A0C2HSE5_9BACT|nr:hypothetical protein [Geoalkalibacter ferrihydriticus]KIH77730.1 hypothetical protein GFER_03495 [Geoalkalibacter ferrihydriticus DSM 17813]SDL76184.1 hypothetical protein SAMN05660860_01216 [Geoalkalibacter ferrihydriticus]